MTLESQDPALLQRRYERERAKRRIAEDLLDERARELYLANEEVRRNQQQLVESEKMASLGVMAAGVAHEINNPIGFVGSNLTTLGEYAVELQEAFQHVREFLAGIDEHNPVREAGRKLEEQLEALAVADMLEDATGLVSESSDGIGRVRDIVQALRVYSHQSTDQKQPLVLGEVVRASLSMLGATFNGLDWLDVSEAETATVDGHAGALTQVVVNLVQNAYDAIEAEGRVRLQTRAGPDDGVELVVDDDGCGIAPEHMDHLFTPFFTTKPVGSGTGLGLSICHGIVAEHGGSIDVQSTPARGTTVIVSFPASGSLQS